MINKEFLKTCQFNDGYSYKNSNGYCAYGALATALSVEGRISDWRVRLCKDSPSLDLVLYRLEDLLMERKISHDDLRANLLALAEEYFPAAKTYEIAEV